MQDAERYRLFRLAPWQYFGTITCDGLLADGIMKLYIVIDKP